MPSGDSTRVWFPEMLDELQALWSETLNWEDCSLLCERMIETRIQLKQQKGLKGPMVHCSQCNTVHEMGLGPITIRSLLFSLHKRGVLTDLELKQLDVVWRHYQAQHHLDGCGKKHHINPATSSVTKHCTG